MKRSYTLEGPDDLYRFPGERLVAFYNRKLRAKGNYDIEWIETPGGGMRLRDADHKQSKMDL